MSEQSQQFAVKSPPVLTLRANADQIERLRSADNAVRSHAFAEVLGANNTTLSALDGHAVQVEPLEEALDGLD